MAGYVHRLMVARSHAGLGLGRALLKWSEREIARSGRARVRLDCVRGNSRLCAHYERCGYRLVGYREFEGHPEPTLDGAVPADPALYEKSLPDVGNHGKATVRGA